MSGKELFTATHNVSRETVDRLEVYHDLLIRWQKVKNLVSRNTVDHIWERHFADSVQLLSHAENRKRWLDFGTGAGFPGMVIALLLADIDKDSHVILVDSDHKKCAFLREVARETSTIVEINCGRIEDFATEYPGIDIVTARAVAPMFKLIEYSLPLLENGAIGLFLKGQDAERELKDIPDSSSLVINLSQSKTDPKGRIVKVMPKASL